MKNIIVILALLFVVSFSASAQGLDARYTDGVTLGAYPAIGQPGTGDSLHYVGRFFLRDKDRLAFDSLSFHITNTDSIRYGILIKGGGVKHTTDTVRVVTNDGAANATHYVQKTAAGVTGVPWYLIRIAMGDEAITMQYIDLYLWVYKVGTETPGSTLSGDTFNVFPKAFK